MLKRAKDKIRECEEAGNNMETLKLCFKTLTTITTENFKSHFEKVLEARDEEDPAVLSMMVERLKDLRGVARKEEVNDHQNDTPSKEEIRKKMMGNVKNSA